MNENGSEQEDFQDDSQEDFQKDSQIDFRELCVRVALIYGFFVFFFVVVIVAGAPKLLGLGPLVFVVLMLVFLPDFREDSLYFVKHLLRK